MAATARFAKIIDPASAAPPANKYMYLSKEQERRSWATIAHTRAQCDVPNATTPTTPLRTLIEGETSHVSLPIIHRRVDWVGRMFRLPQRAAHALWNLCSYGVPAGARCRYRYVLESVGLSGRPSPSAPCSSYGGHGIRDILVR